MLLPPSPSSDLVIVPAGEMIFRQGEDGDWGYLIEDGLVEVLVDGPEHRSVGLRGPGALIGEMAILQGGKRLANVVARTDCRLTLIRASRIVNYLDRADPVLRMVVDTLIDRLRDMLHGPRAGAVEAGPDAAKSQSIMLRAVLQIRRESEFRAALERGRIKLHFQPIVSLQGGGVVGFEGLARWHDPERGMVPPSEFIPLAEASGMMGVLTRQCLEQAAMALHVLDSDRTRAGERLFVNVNVSSQDLTDPSFAPHLADFARRWPIVRGRLKIEITESALMSDPDMALATLNLCRTLGIGVAIDDFGTGYSSLSYLHRLPIDVLKIDQSFIRSMADDAHSTRIVRTILRLADEMGVPAVSEGLEIPAEVAELQRMGCKLGQGYHFARPMPLEDTSTFMSRWMLVEDGPRAASAFA